MSVTVYPNCPCCGVVSSNGLSSSGSSGKPSELGSGSGTSAAQCKNAGTLELGGDLAGNLLSVGGTIYSGEGQPVPPIGFFSFGIGVGCSNQEYFGSWVKYSLGVAAFPPEVGSTEVTIVSANPVSLICSFSCSVGSFDFTVNEVYP